MPAKGDWYRALLEHSTDIVAVIDGDGTIEYKNPATGIQLGYDPGDLIAEDAFNYVHPEDRERVEDRISPVIEGDRYRSEPYRYRFRHADGSWQWFESVLTDCTDTPVEGYLVNSRDVTEQRERQAELEVTRRRLEAILENTPLPMFLKSSEGEYLLVNDEYRSLFGSDGEVVGRTTDEIHPPDVAAQVRANDEEVIQRGKSIQTEDRIVVDGEERYYLTTKVPIYDIGTESDPDSPVAIFGVAQDITERLAYREQLERKNERLEEFASIISHDLRNPIAVAAGNLELAREESDSQYLDTVAESLDRSQALITDLLTLAREGEQVTEPERTSLRDVAENSWRTVQTDDARLTVQADREILADGSRLSQMFENLFRNAVEHGSGSRDPDTRRESADRSTTDDRSRERYSEGADDSSGVTVTIGVTEGGFFVADDGSGIPGEDREKVFESGYSTAEEGTGFGLAIVSEIADAHGWEVDVTESENGGARFEITGVEFVS